MVTLTKPTAAQNSCSTPIGNCNYEVTTNGTTPSYVGAYAEITNTMSVQSYSGSSPDLVTLQYNPDTSMTCNPLIAGFDLNWVQGAILYGVVWGIPGGPGSEGDLYLTAWEISCTSKGVEWTNYYFYEPTASLISWPLISGAWWFITYNVGSNGLISSISEGVYVPSVGEWTSTINVNPEYTNRWFRSNVVWAGDNYTTVIFNSGGSGTFYYCSNLPLYQGPLAQNTAENSNVKYTQIYTVPISPYPYPPSSPWICLSYEEVYQGFQT